MKEKSLVYVAYSAPFYGCLLADRALRPKNANDSKGPKRIVVNGTTKDQAESLAIRMVRSSYGVDAAVGVGQLRRASRAERDVLGESAYCIIDEE